MLAIVDNQAFKRWLVDNVAAVWGDYNDGFGTLGWVADGFDCGWIGDLWLGWVADGLICDFD